MKTEWNTHAIDPIYVKRNSENKKKKMESFCSFFFSFFFVCRLYSPFDRTRTYRWLAHATCSYGIILFSRITLPTWHIINIDGNSSSNNNNNRLRIVRSLARTLQSARMIGERVSVLVCIGDACKLLISSKYMIIFTLCCWHARTNACSGRLMALRSLHWEKSFDILSARHCTNCKNPNKKRNHTRSIAMCGREHNKIIRQCTLAL